MWEKLQMRKYYYVIVASLCIIVAYIFIRNTQELNVSVYVDRDSSHNGVIISETSYIPDSQGASSFFVCKTKQGENKSSCKKINGIQHGSQKWYNNGVLTEEILYDHGNKTKTTKYYKNGLKNKEYMYEQGKVKQINFYSRDNGNQVVKTIFYKNNEKIKKYFENKKLYKEEKYKNDKLVSRKIYDRDGLLQRLEEYEFIGDPDSFDNFFDGFDSSSPYLFDFPNNQDDNNNREYKNMLEPINQDNSVWI